MRPMILARLQTWIFVNRENDDISTFTDLDFCEPGKLEYVVKENGNGICYPYSVVTDSDRKEYAFFLPEAWVSIKKAD